MLLLIGFKIILVLVLRRYLIELSTTNSMHPIHSIKLNLCCFLLIWCDLTEFNLFWCKNIKIFVFWLFFVLICVLKGLTESRCGYKILIIPTRKHALLLVLVKVLYRSSPTPLITGGTPTSDYISPMSSILLYSVISFGILLASGVG